MHAASLRRVVAGISIWTASSFEACGLSLVQSNSRAILSRQSDSQGTNSTWEVQSAVRENGHQTTYEEQLESARSHLESQLEEVTYERNEMRKELDFVKRHTYKTDVQTALKGEQEENLCVDGKLVPQLYLLGALKTSTTLFADNVNRSSGIVFSRCTAIDTALMDWMRCSPHQPYFKEPHFFDFPVMRDRGKEFWLSHWPSCDQETRLVAADMTPNYLQISSTADIMKYYYGDKISDVTFIVMIREPLETIQSAYYFLYESAVASTAGADKFKEFVTEYMAQPPRRTFGEEDDVDAAMKNVMYAYHLEKWFETMSRKQFIIVPMKYNTEYSKEQPGFHEFIWERFGLPHPDTREEIEEKANVGPSKSSVRADLGEDLFLSLRDRVYGITAPVKLGRLLQSDDPDDQPTLYGFQGDPNNADEIALWIRQGW